MLLQGKELSERIISRIAKEVKGKRKPRLAIVVVGDYQPSQIYVRKKIETAKRAGIETELFHLPEKTTERKLLWLVDRLNNDKRIDGFIVQLPVPKQIDANKVIEAIDPRKDVDGLNSSNLGKIALGLDGFAPATPSGIIALLEHYKVRIEGANATIVGRSGLVGKPIALMLLNRNATVSICHSKTRNLAEHTKKADILVVAAGSPGLIEPWMVKKGAYVIDVGTTRVQGKIMGDVHPSVQKKANVSPATGGVGPLTVAMLLQNTLKAAKMKKT